MCTEWHNCWSYRAHVYTHTHCVGLAGLTWFDPEFSGRGTSLMVQWLRLCASTAAGAGSVPGQETMMSLPNNKKLKKKKFSAGDFSLSLTPILISSSPLSPQRRKAGLQLPVYELHLPLQLWAASVGNTKRKQVQVYPGPLAWQLGKPPSSLFLSNLPAFSQLLEPASWSQWAFLPLLGLEMSSMAPHCGSCEPGPGQVSDELSSSSDQHCLTCLLVM